MVPVAFDGIPITARLLDELNRGRNHAISLEIENKHLRAEVGAKVIEFVPRHLRKPIAA